MKIKGKEYEEILAEYNDDIEDIEYGNLNPYDLLAEDVGVIFITLSNRRAIYCGDVINYVNKRGYNNYLVIKFFVDLSTGNFFILHDCNRGHSDGNTFSRVVFDKNSHGFDKEGVHIDEYLAS